SRGGSRGRSRCRTARTAGRARGRGRSSLLRNRLGDGRCFGFFGLLFRYGAEAREASRQFGLFGGDLAGEFAVGGGEVDATGDLAVQPCRGVREDAVLIGLGRGDLIDFSFLGAPRVFGSVT